MRLIVVRHAEAAPGEPDELRRLTPEGRDRARALADRLPRADAVLSSPLVRARETAEPIARAAGVPVEADERLAPGASPEGVLEAVAGRGATIVVVGHQPDCGHIAAALGGGEERPFPPGAAHAIEL